MKSCELFIGNELKIDFDIESKKCNGHIYNDLKA